MAAQPEQLECVDVDVDVDLVVDGDGDGVWCCPLRTHRESPERAPRSAAVRGGERNTQSPRRMIRMARLRVFNAMGIGFADHVAFEEHHGLTHNHAPF